MGNGAPWGFESKVKGSGYGGKRILLMEKKMTPLSSSSISRTILVAPDGLVWFESGTEKDSLSGIWVPENEEVEIPSGTWSRMTGMRNSMVYEFSGIADNAETELADEGGEVSDDDFRDLLGRFVRTSMTKNLLGIDDAREIAIGLNKEGRKTGFCCGNFDLIHLGHAELLLQSKQRCEILFVAVNSDESIRKKKGKTRPFIDEAGRANMVACIKFVDYVIFNEGLNFASAIEAVSPHVFITTTDHGENSPEVKAAEKIGSKVEIIDLIPGYGTTRIANLVSKSIS